MKHCVSSLMPLVLSLVASNCNAQSDCEERYNEIWHIAVDDMISDTGSNSREIKAVLQDCAKNVPAFKLYGVHSTPGQGNVMQFAVMLDDNCLLDEYFAQSVPVLGVTNSEGEFTTLHTAAMYGAPNAARWLLKKKLDPNIRGIEGLTPLMVASFRTSRHEQVAKLLVEFGADASIKDDAGYDAHFYAKRAGDEQYIAWLDSLGQQ